MQDYLFKGTNIDCLVKTDAINPSSGSNFTIMEIRDNGSTKIAKYFNKGIIYSEGSLKTIATSIGGITLTATGEGKDAKVAARTI